MIRDLIARYGWKTILGTVLYSIGEIMGTYPELGDWSAMLKAVGALLGGVGLRAAVAKMEVSNAS